MSQPENGPFIPAIRWPVPNNRGGEFSNLEEMLAHLEGETPPGTGLSAAMACGTAAFTSVIPPRRGALSAVRR